MFFPRTRSFVAPKLELVCSVILLVIEYYLPYYMVAKFYSRFINPRFNKGMFEEFY